jgi:D-glycero-D-manno-heptose 1,7-bisphosphate phosphatase
MSDDRLSTVFLDRDGVINAKRDDDEYVTSWDQFHFLPGSKLALRLLNQAGMWVVIVTNQRGVALGRMTQPELDRLHRRLLAEIALAGGACTAIYACTHLTNQCSCRKPATGLFLRARQDLPEIDFERSVVVGDSVTDLLPGGSLGCKMLLVTDLPEALTRSALAECPGPVRVASSLLELVLRYVLPVSSSETSRVLRKRRPPVVLPTT